MKDGEPEGAGWSPGARGLVSAALVFHLLAVLVGVLGASPPFSEVERRAYGLFKPYYDLIDQGYAYRYYAPEPPPTPVVEATVHYADGRPDEVVRLPTRGVWPRLRYQRQLALANWMYQEAMYAKELTNDVSKSHWARSYAKHLCRTRPGCDRVTIRALIHRVPELDRVREALAAPRRKRVDLDAVEFYDTPELIGEFRCDAF